jgi:hypothetical protein
MRYCALANAALKGGPQTTFWPALQGGVFATLFPQGS